CLSSRFSGQGNRAACPLFWSRPRQRFHSGRASGCVDTLLQATRTTLEENARLMEHTMTRSRCRSISTCSDGEVRTSKLGERLHSPSAFFLAIGFLAVSVGLSPGAEKIQKQGPASLQVQAGKVDNGRLETRLSEKICVTVRLVAEEGLVVEPIGTI